MVGHDDSKDPSIGPVRSKQVSGMKDEKKTKNDLLRELRELRLHARLLETLGIQPGGTDAKLPLRHMLDAIHDGITLMDRDLTVVLTNSTVDRWYAHAMPVLGRKCHDVFLGRKAPCHDCPSLRAMETGAVQHYEAQRLGPEGPDGWLEVYASPIMDEEGRAVAVLEYSRDITKRRQAEEALSRSEENYRLLVENQADMVVKFDPQGHILFASPALCRALGRSEAQLIGSHYGPLVHPEDRPIAEAGFGTLFAPPYTLTSRTRVLTASGWRWQQWSHRAVVNVRGEVSEVVGTGRDIEDQKRAETALQESEARFRTLTETATVAIFIIQGEHIVYINPAGEQLCGRSLEELHPLPFWEIAHPDMRETVRAYGLARQKGESPPSSYEMEIQLPSGQTRWADLSVTSMEYRGAPAIIGTASDITERRRATLALRDSEARFRSVFESAAVGIALADTRGVLVDVNHTFLDMLGYEAHEALGRSASDFAFPEETDVSEANQRRALAAPSTPFRTERRYRRKDGSELWADISVSPILDQNGRVSALMAVLLDIGEAKRASLALNETLDELDSVLDNSLVGIAVMRDRVITRVNSRMADMLGYTAQELLGRSSRVIHISDKHFEEFGQVYHRRLDRTQFTNIEYPLMRKDGREIWCRLAGKAIDRSNLSRGVVWCVEDVTEEKKAQQALRQYAKDLFRAKQQVEESARRLAAIIGELDEKNERLEMELAERKRVEEALRESELRYRELSIRDELTGLFNARHFFELAEAEIRRTTRYGHPLSLIFIDLDDFKKFNDAHGHLAGDKVLAALGRVLSSSIRDTDAAFRYGGEEFIILLPETPGKEAMLQADRVREAFRGITFTPAQACQTLSVGVAQFKAGETLREFIHRADQAMYRAKSSGKNQCRLAD